MIYNTESRKKILEFLRDNKDKSFSAEEIFSAVFKSGAGKSTVFRQLAKLTEELEIKRLADSRDRSVRYQYLDRESCRAHLHLKCYRCGKLIHLDDELTSLFEKNVKSSKRFSIDMSAFIPGVCDNCVVKEEAI